MRRLLPLLVLIVVPVPSAALADGCPPSTCGSTSSAVPGSTVVFVHPYGQPGPIRAFDVRTGKKRFGLPDGVLSADGSTFLAAVTSKADRTTIVLYDAPSGKLRHGWSLRGRWGVAAVSADGRHSVLDHYWRGGVTLRVGSARTALRGAYEVEALSPDGRKVFLVHWNRNGYDLRQLDLVTQKLTPTRLADPDEKMSGEATTGVATRDGHWLLTLYVKSDMHSFVHALDLTTGIAHCIDLPLTGDLSTLGTSALTLSPDESTLYVAAPYVGRLATIDLGTLEVRRVVRFRALSQWSIDPAFGASGAITPNGRMLAFAAGNSLWLYDTAFGVLRRPTRLRWSIAGIGFRPDGRSLVALQRHAGPVFLDAATGERRRQAQP
jgi:hypothetical protein